MLDIRAVDAHAAAAQLHAVENHIIGLRPHLWFGLVVLHQLHILQKRHGEGVVHGGIALFVLFVFKHGKIRHQCELEIARVGQSQQVRAFQAQAAQHAPHHLQPVGAEEDEVAGPCVHAHFQIPPHLWFKILGQNGVDLPISR